MIRVGRLHNPGRSFAGGCTPDRESRMVAVAVSLVIGASGLVGVVCRLASGRVGTGVQPLQGENYTYSCVLGHVQLWIWLHIVGRSTYIILPPSSPLFLLR